MGIKTSKIGVINKDYLEDEGSGESKDIKYIKFYYAPGKSTLKEVSEIFAFKSDVPNEYIEDVYLEWSCCIRLDSCQIDVLKNDGTLDWELYLQNY